ncbi:MAG: DUF4342 domain-containing protein [Clostridia bacterium]|nr:DUF4342 domain-containing protein [Clostridia bacterium]
MDELQKIDLIRERMDVTYEEAREALNQAGGDVVAALIRLEQEKGSWHCILKGERIWSGFKGLLHRTNQTKVIIKRNGETLLSLPVSLSIAGLAAIMASEELTVMAGIGTAAAILNGCHLELVSDEEPEDEFIFIS